MLTRPTLGASALRAQLSVDLPREPQSLGSHPTTNGGGGGIRTHGAFQLSSFQDWRNRPLYHPSKYLLNKNLNVYDTLRPRNLLPVYCHLSYFII